MASEFTRLPPKIQLLYAAAEVFLAPMHRILIPLFLLLFPTLEAAQEHPLFFPVESLLAKQDYSGAKALLSQRLKIQPQDNDALYLRVAVDQTEILDYESYLVDGARFNKVADSIRNVLECRAHSLTGMDSLRCVWYAGSICGGISVIMAKNGAWIPALKSAGVAKSRMREAARCDSTFYSARLGLGLFHYYAGKSFGWLPFVDAKGEQQGLREIELSAKSPYPYDLAAKNSLCWILIDKKLYARADSIAKTALEEAPGNSLFLRIRCLSLLRMSNNREAVAIASKFAASSIARRPVNWSDYVLAAYVFIAGNDALKNSAEVINGARSVEAAGIPNEFREIPHIKKNLRKIADIAGKYRK